MKNHNGLSVAEMLGNWSRTMMRSKSKQPRTVAVFGNNKRPVIVSCVNGKVPIRWAD